VKDERKIAKFDIYCDVCDELIPEGETYYEDEFGNRICTKCEEA